MIGSLPRDRCASRETAPARHPCVLAPVCTALNRTRPAPTVERVDERRRRELSCSCAACCCPQGCAFGGRTASQVLWHTAQRQVRRGHVRPPAFSTLTMRTSPRARRRG